MILNFQQFLKTAKIQMGIFLLLIALSAIDNSHSYLSTLTIFLALASPLISTSLGEFAKQLQQSPLYSLEMLKERTIRRSLIRLNAHQTLTPLAARSRR